MRIHLGADNIPFLTKKSHVPDYRNGDPRYAQPQPTKHVYVNILDLANENDLARYEMIWRNVGLGNVGISREEMEWVEKDQSWKVMLRWFISGKMDPAELRDLQLGSAREVSKLRGV
jgi:hypothetical protein